MDGVTSSCASPELVTVTDLVTGEPAVTVLNAREVALTVALPAMPVPFSGTLWNPTIFASSARLRLAVVGPVAAGSNVTSTEHEPPAGTVVPSQLLRVTLKASLPTPAMYAWSTFSGSVPVLATVTVLEARLFVLSTTSTDPRSSDVASNATLGCGAGGAVHGAPGPPATRSPFS